MNSLLNKVHISEQNLHEFEHGFKLLIRFANVPALLDAPKVVRLVVVEIGELNLGVLHIL